MLKACEKAHKDEINRATGLLLNDKLVVENDKLSLFVLLLTAFDPVVDDSFRTTLVFLQCNPVVLADQQLRLLATVKVSSANFAVVVFSFKLLDYLMMAVLDY